MNVELKKGAGGPPAITCVRADGTRTWGKLHPFLPVHDLTHLAVESVLGFKEAFFGLVASGWEIDEFAAPGASKRAPLEARWAESIVGLFDLERGTGRIWSARELDEALALSLQGQGVTGFRPIAESELADIRRLRSEFTARWDSLAPGDRLAITFPAIPGGTNR
jgi:hypothetical protein